MLIVHRGERADVLADVLAGQLATPLPDPMVPEIVAVPERGVERWLRQRLATRLGTGGAGDGVAANIDFDSPSRLLRQVVIATSEDPDGAEAWYTDALRWPVLQVLDEHLDDSRLSVLSGHLGGGIGDDARVGRRLSAAFTIARLFSAYGWQRPTMLADWAADRYTDGAGRELPEHLRWQPWFWQLVRERVGQPHLAEQMAGALDRIRSQPDLVDLPDRFAFFGPTRIPQAMREVLGALADHREVSLYLPHPSDALWRSVARRPGAVPRPRMRPGPEIPEPERPDHPLLAAMARDVQELQEVLTPLIDEDRHHPAAQPGTGLLGALQDGLRRDELVRADGVTADSTLEVHACHGPERQVEVLRDRLLRLFQDDPTLEPRDVLILCPEVETFAPLIQGAFGQEGLEHPGFSLRVRMADRGLRETNEVLDVLDRVLDLGAGRVRASELLELAGMPAVARRFGFTEKELESLTGWVERSGIRWGIDGTQRRRFGMEKFGDGTVAAGRDRILLGALGEEDGNEWLGDALPMDGIDSTDIDAAGRFAELVERLGDLLTAMTRSRSARDWSGLLVSAVDRLTEPASDAQWQRSQAIAMVTEALDTGDTIELRLSDLRELMNELLVARPTRSNFCTGELTVCTMVPMRSVPHRAILLLGLDEDAFPRSGVLDGDDVLAQTPLIGERDRRDEDRQVFLDALSVATEHFSIFYTGADPSTGATVPPPVLVSELCEAVGRVLGRDGEAIVTTHTLHAFDLRNFQAGNGGPESYDARLLAGARALQHAASAPDGSGGGPAAVCLPALTEPDVDLDRLISYFEGPTEQFVRQRLGAVIPESEEGFPDQLPVELDSLEEWKIGDRILRNLIRGEPARDIAYAERRRGTLPPSAFGTEVLRPAGERAQAVAAAAMSRRTGDGDAVDVRVDLSGGRRLYGTVGDVFGDQLIPVVYSVLGTKYLLRAWIRLLAVAAGSSLPVRGAVAIGSRRRGVAEASIRDLPAPTPQEATELLETLVAIRDAGLRTPLWLPQFYGQRVAQTLRNGGTRGAVEYMRQTYRDDSETRWVNGHRREARVDPYLGLVLTDDPTRIPSFEDVLTLGSGLTDDDFAGRLPHIDEAPLFVRLADAIYSPTPMVGGRR